MTIYAETRGGAGSAIIYAGRETISIERPCEMLRKLTKCEYSVICGGVLIDYCPTKEDAERLVKAIAAAERDGKPFITVSGGEVVEDQSGGEV
jgi:hypothetical protein